MFASCSILYDISKNYYFYVKDHLGNNRIVANFSGEIVQSNQYYPFGMEFADGMGQDRRYYDPSHNRFATVNPHAEGYYSWSPYLT